VTAPPQSRGRTILVATDGSEAAHSALQVAIDLAKASGDRLVLVAVWHELRADFGIPLYELIPSLIEVPREWAAETLAADAAKASAAGVEVETLSHYGNPAREICRVARELRPRLIVIGSTGWGPSDGTLFGSVSKDVVNHAPCPVLVVPESALLTQSNSARGHEAARSREAVTR
jgi:nucleotide-binding universal stress UspA family protein